MRERILAIILALLWLALVVWGLSGCATPEPSPVEVRKAQIPNWDVKIGNVYRREELEP